MLNLKNLFQADTSQVATSNLQKLRQSQGWEKLSDTEVHSIQGGSDPSWGPPPRVLPPGAALIGSGGW